MMMYRCKEVKKKKILHQKVLSLSCWRVTCEGWSNYWRRLFLKTRSQTLLIAPKLFHWEALDLRWLSWFSWRLNCTTHRFMRPLLTLTVSRSSPYWLHSSLGTISCSWKSSIFTKRSLRAVNAVSSEARCWRKVTLVKLLYPCHETIATMSTSLTGKSDMDIWLFWRR